MFVFCVSIFQAQNLKAYGVLKDFLTKTPICAGEINVYHDGELVGSFLTDEKGEYSIELKLGYVYAISYNKAGFYSKFVGLNTIGSEDSLVFKYLSTRSVYESSYKIRMDLDLSYAFIPYRDDVFLQPIAWSYYDGELGGFTFDMDYVDSIKEDVESFYDSYNRITVDDSKRNQIIDISTNCQKDTSAVFKEIHDRMHEVCSAYNQENLGYSYSGQPHNENLVKASFIFEKEMERGEQLIKNGKLEKALLHFENMELHAPNSSLVKKKIKRLKKILDES